MRSAAPRYGVLLMPLVHREIDERTQSPCIGRAEPGYQATMVQDNTHPEAQREPQDEMRQYAGSWLLKGFVTDTPMGRAAQPACIWLSSPYTGEVLDPMPG